jgi:hypothetical protein
VTRRGGAAAILAILSLGGCAAAGPAEPTAPIGHAELQLVGFWTGDVDSSGEGVLDMAVSDAAADGTTFDGELTFSVDGIGTTEVVHAYMTAHGHLVADIGADASIELHIADPATLDYCFIRYGTDFVYSCGRLARQS